MNGALWDDIVAVRRGHGAPMPDDSDLSLPALVSTLAEILAELDLHQANVVYHDWGGAQPLISPGGTYLIAQLLGSRWARHCAFVTLEIGAPCHCRRA